jgi:hypothetical protein
LFTDPFPDDYNRDLRQPAPNQDNPQAPYDPDLLPEFNPFHAPPYPKKEPV